METHVCAVITDEETNLRYLFIDVSKLKALFLEAQKS